MLTLNHFLNTNGNHTFLANGSVIGHNHDFVAILLDVVNHNNEILCATCKYRDNTVAGFLQSSQDRQNGSNADTATSADNSTIILDP